MTAPIIDTVRNFFDEDEWRYFTVPETGDLLIDITGRNGQYVCYAKAREESSQFLFYAMCPVKAPENKRHAMSEFISRANYGLVIGNFELDFRDGEVRYKTSIDVEGSQLDPQLVRNMVYVTISMIDKYLPGIMAVIYGGKLPEDALAQVEDSL